MTDGALSCALVDCHCFSRLCCLPFLSLAPSRLAVAPRTADKADHGVTPNELRLAPTEQTAAPTRPEHFSAAA